jgi:hypothetical protein
MTADVPCEVIDMAALINAVTWSGKETNPFEHLAIHPHAAHSSSRLKRHHAIDEDTWDWDAKRHADPGLRSYVR